MKGQSLESMIRSTCKQVLGNAVNDGEISGPSVPYLETGTKSFSCTGKPQVRMGVRESACVCVWGGGEEKGNVRIRV